MLRPGRTSNGLRARHSARGRWGIFRKTPAEPWAVKRPKPGGDPPGDRFQIDGRPYGPRRDAVPGRSQLATLRSTS
jgi:hypothetical protein